MRLLPEMEKLAEKYKGKVVFYKVNADKEANPVFLRQVITNVDETFFRMLEGYIF